MSQNAHTLFPPPNDRSHAEDLRPGPISEPPHHGRGRFDTFAPSNSMRELVTTNVLRSDSLGTNSPDKKRKGLSSSRRNNDTRLQTDYATRPSNPVNRNNPSPPDSEPRGSSINNERRSNGSALTQNGTSPAILLREKKQKACANCRRAKLKCIVEDGSTDCIRCASRKERCIFYPRAHDEDWQQTMTTDLYGSIRHLSHLSHAVTHILHHLTNQGIIPPLPGPPLQPFEPVERDTSILQGWNAERNKELPFDKKEPSKRKRQEEDERIVGDPQAEPPSFGYRTPHRHPDPLLPLIPMSAPLMSHRSSAPESALGRQSSTVLPNSTAHSESDLSRPLLPFSTSSSSITLPTPQSRMLPQPLTATNISISPQNPQNATPASLVGSSPSGPSKTPGEWPSSQNVIELLNREPHADRSETIDLMDDSPRALMGEPEILFDEDGIEVYGSADTRRTIIKDGILPARAARQLVEYFHMSLSPNLFGYHLQQCHFPYLPDGFRSITPFILAVECLLASERVVHLQSRHADLADAVLKMMLTSPAESWQTIQNSKKRRACDEQVLGDALARSDMDWDPELGIGPEEIVAVCVLATFISQREQAKTIALFAFTWAQGWTNFLREDHCMTFAEATSLVTPLRRPSLAESARIWLLAYIVAGQENLQESSVATALPTDPMSWCKVVLPDEHPGPDTTSSPHDIILVYHAKLTSILLQWLNDRGQMPRPTSTNLDAVVRWHVRLAEKISQNLDWWAEDLKAYNLGFNWTKQILLDWLHAKSLVHSLCAQHVGGTPRGEAAKSNSRMIALDSAVNILQRLISFNPPEAVTLLPQVYYRMMVFAVVDILDALTEIEGGRASPTSCPIKTGDALRLMAQVAQVLSSVELPDGHYVKIACSTLRQHVETLSRISQFNHGIDFAPAL